VCGEQYEYCHTNRTVAGVFRWQDVACCPEHGSIYLTRVLESRGSKPVEDNVAAKNDGVVTDFSDLIEYEEDELFEKDFEDEDDEAE
ncbi:MAG: hypothetical protein K2F81_08410, partial [Ruminococcus sp.]|nr:hypothetical protein [Ruminococcus sp.]